MGQYWVAIGFLSRFRVPKILCAVLDWRKIIPIPRYNADNRVHLHLLERYGGWRYLLFLESIKHHMEEQALGLYDSSREATPSMSAGQAKAVMLCLDRMAWNEVTLRDAKQDDLADILARVEIYLR